MQVKSLFLSDIHLGLKKSKRKKLLKLLDNIEADNYFLLGDIIDLWKLRSSFSWSTEDNDVIRKLLKLAKKKNVVYIPGNHDELLRDYDGLNFGGILIKNEYTHITSDGVSILLVHGDIFDKIILHDKWLAVLGSYMYDILLEINELNSWVREKLGLKPWSLSMYLKHKAKEATNVMQNFKNAAIEYSHRKGSDIVITGHMHKPEVSGLYCNCGDFIENCSYIYETKDGEIKLGFV